MLGRTSTAKTRTIAVAALAVLRQSDVRLSIPQLAARTGFTANEMKSAVRRLVKRGKVDHEGRGPGSGYVVRPSEVTA